jgi:hypothetical protein
MRSAIFLLVGALLLAIATFLYGFVFLDGAMEQPAFRLVVGGTLVGGFIGLLLAALTRPSGARRTSLFLIGALGGLFAGLAFGVISLECPPGSEADCLGWEFLGRGFHYPWMPIALWTVVGGCVGAIIGLIAAGLVREQKSAPVSVESS